MAKYELAVWPQDKYRFAIWFSANGLHTPNTVIHYHAVLRKAL